MSTQVLKLTGLIQPGASPGVYVGRIQEIGGIFAQGNTEEEAYQNLLETTAHMIEVYKRPQALALLTSQTHNPALDALPAEEKLEFTLERELASC
ncbi:type II toxin-antitoxin system HicB family antitoxin [Hymenobacter mucosus]|uniref:Nuclease of the RNAse H fold, HicB family n=1 Tax=Hymenobacter mucosus TaxID=1411120 RepID=A0A239AAX2_9BACT|nr:type II toxin-antitoxin system HicB family antitoxin [Hymenobacter mucosus]SNR92689.1 hypothetical protein SAMN06269173_111115 [Hymenobacter mucosus]